MLDAAEVYFHCSFSSVQTPLEPLGSIDPHEAWGGGDVGVLGQRAKVTPSHMIVAPSTSVTTIFSRQDAVAAAETTRWQDTWSFGEERAAFPLLNPRVKLAVSNIRDAKHITTSR